MNLFLKCKSFNFDKVQFINFFISYAFGVVSKKSLLDQKSQRFTLFSFKDFIILAFKFRSVIHFELIFMYGVGKHPNSSFCI